MNLTQEDASYFGTDLPYFSSSTSTSKTITSSLTQSIDATVVVNVADCEFAEDFSTYQGNHVTPSSCSGGIGTYILTIPSGSSLLLIGGSSQIEQGVCSTLLNLHTLTAGKMALLFLAFTFMIVLGAVSWIFYLTGDKADAGSGVNPYMMIIVFIAMLIGAILVGISALITTSLCAL